MTAATSKRFSPGLVLAMLMIAYIFNFLDRQLLGILAAPIKSELELTDTQLGLLGGLAFAALYSVLGVPAALLADRTSRSWVVTIALAIWSGFTALCGLAAGFWQLFLCRLGVGVGEAGGLAPSYALIADYFPPGRRARALGIYSMGVPIGLAMGAMLGGYIAQNVDWRTAFIVIGLAGTAIAPMLKYIVRDISRPAPAARVEAARVSAVFAILARKPSFWLIAFAASMSSLCGNGLAFWLPSVLIRSFGFDLLQVGMFAGSLLLVGGAAGVYLGGVLADKLGWRDRGYYVKLPAYAWLLSVPLFAAGLLSASPMAAWLLLLVPNGLTILWLGPLATAIQHLVPAHMRATASASYILITNLVGLGLGSLVMGALSDGMTALYGQEALRYATVACLVFYLIAAALAMLAIKPLRTDWVEETHD